MSGAPVRLLRVALAGLLIIASSAAVYRLCWVRYECEVVKREAESDLRNRSLSGYEEIVVARRATERLRRCLERDPSDYQTYFLLARAAEALGSTEQALSLYGVALKLNERPEIYARIAVLEFQLGRPKEAEEHILRACYFQIFYSAMVADPMQAELYAKVLARQERLSKIAEQRRLR